MEWKMSNISPGNFVERLLPKPDGGEPEPSDDVCASFAKAFAEIASAKPEALMYEPMLKAFNREGLLTPGLTARATLHKPGRDARLKQKIYGGIYPVQNYSGEEQDRTDWTSILLGIECKVDPTQDDPFDDSKPPDYIPSSFRRRLVTGQLLSYAQLTFDHQHLLHHFDLLILGRMARFARWDRSGGIFSEKFDYVAHPEILVRYLWRFSRMTREQQGLDPTATRILPGTDDYELIKRRRAEPHMEKGHPIGEHARLEFKRLTRDDRQLWRLEVHDKEHPRAFLTGKPHFVADGLAGRGTHGFVAIDLASPDGPLVYLKDAWRVAHKRMRLEGDILAYLKSDTNGGAVKNVPTVVCHGDVGSQRTLTQEVWKELHPEVPESECRLKTHQHYRMVVREVGKPVSEFRDGRDLVRLMINYLIAHRDAFRKGFIHRDISIGNVLIYPEETVDDEGGYRVRNVGILADWELAKHEDDVEGGPRQPGRTGTWQFLSVNVLDDPSKHIEVRDEIEAVFHLLLYVAIRYLPHNCDDVGAFMTAYFDGFRGKNLEFYCGEKKAASMYGGQIQVTQSVDLKFYSRPQPPAKPAVPGARQRLEVSPAKPPPKHPIQRVFNRILGLLHAHHKLCRVRTLEADASGPAETPADLPTPTRPAGEVDDFDADAAEHNLEDAVHDLSPTSEDETDAAAMYLPAETVKDLEARAAKLDDHQAIIDILYLEGRKRNWPKDDKLPDQLPPNYDPKTIPSGVSSTGSKKRSFAEASASDESLIAEALAKRIRRQGSSHSPSNPRVSRTQSGR